jgi:hypothetical protein
LDRGSSEVEAAGQKLVIGVDFDNTIADYDELMYAIARERGLIDPGFARNKKLIRDAIRTRRDGETHWRGVQVTAYGPRMHEARLIEGVRDFFLECKRREIPVYIVSHKTEYANFGDATVNLREAAAAWLEQQGFFEEAGIGLSRERVFFESTRAGKIDRIRALGATHFIDDLEETFREESFPAGVAKILFAAHGRPAAVADAVSFPTWRGIFDRVFGADDLEAVVRLAGEPVRTVTRIGRGGNSKTYRVDCASGRSYAAKFYFQQTMDGLNRLEVEFTSLEFLWRNGERDVPQPLAMDRDSRIALYQFVEAEPIDSHSVTEREISQLVAFAVRLKKLSTAATADRLPCAAEACFSFAELHENIQSRLARLDSAVGDAPSYSALRSFLDEELRPALDFAVERIKAEVGSAGWSAELPRAARTLSPSDFGFHNALRRSDGSVVLLDFEYFGWDDPAKLIADFVLHPAMELGDQAKHAYVRGMLECFADDADLPQRLALSFPLFAIKWCAILLNEFVPLFLQRREFALRGTMDREDVRLRQLGKARRMLAAGADLPC